MSRSCAWLLVLGFLLAGCSSPAFRPAPDLVDDPSPVVHRLAIADTLLIRFPYATQFDQSVTVRTDGLVTPPFIAPVLAAGRPPEEVETDLRAAYTALTKAGNAAPGEKVYRIAPGDRLEVRFHQPPELTDTIDVRPDGRISVALAGSLVAEGRTPEELTADLRAAYAPFVKEPDLVVILRGSALGRVEIGAVSTRIPSHDLDGASVIITSFAEREIFVMGEVTRPSRVPYRSHLTALQAVAAAGGLTPGGQSGGVMVLRRPASGPVVAFRLDLGDDLAGKPGQDMQLRPFDIVVVPRTPIAEVAHVMDQYIYQIIPGLRNSSVTFIYNLRKDER
jgi:protein involved in polysaccharide export with SLBB domain